MSVKYPLSFSKAEDENRYLTDLTDNHTGKTSIREKNGMNPFLTDT